MPILTVGNGFTTTIPGLGAALRDRYGQDNVVVSCSAAFESGEWVGACEIRGEPHERHEPEAIAGHALAGQNVCRRAARRGADGPEGCDPGRVTA